jgi:hypothetical protein
MDQDAQASGFEGKSISGGGMSMPSNTSFQSLQCSDNSLLCRSCARARSKLFTPVDCRGISIRRFSSANTLLKPGSQNPVPRDDNDNGGNGTQSSGWASGPKFGRETSFAAKEKAAGWGSTPSFTAKTSFSPEEARIREALVKAKQQEEQVRCPFFRTHPDAVRSAVY